MIGLGLMVVYAEYARNLRKKVTPTSFVREFLK